MYFYFLFQIMSYKDNIRYILYYMSGFTQFLYDYIYKSVHEWILTAEDIHTAYLQLIVRYDKHNIVKALDIYEAHKDILVNDKTLTPSKVHEYIFVNELIDFYDPFISDIVIIMIIYAKAKGIYNLPSYIPMEFHSPDMFTRQHLLPTYTDFVAKQKEWYYYGNAYTKPLIYALHTYQNITGTDIYSDTLMKLKNEDIDRKVLKYMRYGWNKEKLLNIIIDAEYSDRFKFSSICNEVICFLKLEGYYIKDEDECIDNINDIIERMCDIHYEEEYEEDFIEGIEEVINA